MSAPEPDAQAAVAPANADAGGSNNNNKKDKAPKEKKDKKGKGEASGSLTIGPEASYIPNRIAIFEKLKAEADAARANLPDVPIQVTLPDGSIKAALKDKTTPLEIAQSISEGLARAVVVAKVNDGPWDLHRPLEGDCRMELCKFDSPEGHHAFWHSSAHILGQAMEIIYGGELGIGPALESGFYYDVFLDGRTISSKDFEGIEEVMKNIVKEKQPFERLVVSRQAAIEMFGYNRFKLEIIEKNIPEDGVVTVYRCGKLIDLCRGPHVPNTGAVTCMALTKESSAYWKGDAANPNMQRLYGISFPNKKQLAEHLEFLAQAKERNHRKIGIDQELFFFDDLSPGSCFFLPHGARIYNKLISFIRDQYWKRGYQEVISPNMYNHQLWLTSGHWQNYKDNMFHVEVEKEIFALKPMNCPGHCVMFKHRTRSYRELPWRVADFGVLHRNELSGALTGLTRVRRFQQDDAHIFCTPDQVQSEVAGVLDFLQEVYGIFNFTFELKLSTRPENSLGTAEVWDKAETALAQALDGFGRPWTINPGDGAFYGPKIDITIFDAMKRAHQCATIQLDFNLPERFELNYNDGGTGADQQSRPVMIHRAILGSVERFLSILTESCGGKWPFWLNPRQAIVLPITDEHNAYAESVRKQLHDAGYYVVVDDSPRTMPKKVFDARAAMHAYILIVGQKEMEAGTVNVRLLEAEKERGAISVAELLIEFAQLTATFK